MNESEKSKRNLAASVRARLLNKARAERLDFNLLLTCYALERALYRLSVSEQRSQFLLKGALLFDIWFDVPHRATHDADLLGFGFRGLSDEFGRDGQNTKQWQAFLGKNTLEPMPLTTVIEALREFLLPVLAAFATSKRVDRNWRAGVGWDGS